MYWGIKWKWIWNIDWFVNLLLFWIMFKLLGLNVCLIVFVILGNVVLICFIVFLLVLKILVEVFLGINNVCFLVICDIFKKV